MMWLKNKYNSLSISTLQGKIVLGDKSITIRLEILWTTQDYFLSAKTIWQWLKASNPSKKVAKQPLNSSVVRFITTYIDVDESQCIWWNWQWTSPHHLLLPPPNGLYQRDCSCCCVDHAIPSMMTPNLSQWDNFSRCGQNRFMKFEYHIMILLKKKLLLKSRGELISNIVFNHRPPRVQRLRRYPGNAKPNMLYAKDGKWTWAISSEVLIIRALLLKLLDTTLVAIWMPSLRSMAFTPWASTLDPSLHMASAKTVLYLVSANRISNLELPWSYKGDSTKNKK